MSRDLQFMFPSPETGTSKANAEDDKLDPGMVALSAALDRENERPRDSLEGINSMYKLSPPRRERDWRSLSPQVELDPFRPMASTMQSRSKTPLRPSPMRSTTVVPTTNANAQDIDWDAGSAIDDVQSILSFDCISTTGSGRMTPDHRLRGSLRAGGGFRPNPELPFPVSSSLFHKFYIPKASGDGENSNGNSMQKMGSAGGQGGSLGGSTYRGALTARDMNIPTATPTRRGSAGLFGGPTTLDPIKSEVYVDEDEENVNSRMTRRTSAIVSEVEDSGIPSYSREFDTQRWRFGMISRWMRGFNEEVEGEGHDEHGQDADDVRLTEPILTESRHSAGSRGTGVTSRRKDDSLASAYAAEITNQFEQLLRWAKRPFCFTLVVAMLGFFLNSMFSTIVIPIICANPGMSTSYPCMPGSRHSSPNVTYYADFPTLMNIESSFEKIVDGAAGGTALARVMKQSEMAVSDLSTVVRYSELKCKESLASKLDAFATDAKQSVRALSGWGSKVGGVLDQ